MSKPRRRGPGSSHAISCTDEQWQVIQTGAARARKRGSHWFVECALTVDPWPVDTTAPPLILKATEQRFISCAARELAAGARSGDEASLQFEDDIRALLEDGILAMVQQKGIEMATELLRSVFGHEHAEVIGSALVPEVVKASGRGKRPGRANAEETTGHMAAQQGDLF